MIQAGPIHERAVAMIEQALHGAYTGPKGGIEKEVGTVPVYVRRNPGADDWSDNLADGVASVKVPDPDWDAVGGIIPDLILYNRDGKPHRLIEVIDTSAPTPGKRAKLEQLQRRGVDVVEVNVHTEDDLKAMFPEEPTGSYRRRRLRHFLNHGQEEMAYRGDRQAETLVMDFIKAVRTCTPATRRKLVAVLQGLDTLESLYPVPTAQAEQGKEE